METKTKTSGLKIGLVVSIALIVVLALFSVWAYSEISSLSSRVNNLETDNDNLQTQVDSLQTDKSTLQSQVSSLETENNQLQTCLDGNITNYESQIESLNSQIATLNSQIDSLDTQITNLQSEIDSLKEPQLHRVEVYWTDNHPLFASPYVSIEGTIFNSGSQTAYSVVYTIRIYDASDTLLKTEEIHLGNIYGKSYETFDVDIEYSGDADYITTTLSYS